MLRAVACLCFLQLFGCGDEPETAQFISPAYGDPCRFLSCSGQGQCEMGDLASGPSCRCAAGYTGRSCERCSDRFHRDANDHCVPDKRCSDQVGDPCGIHGTCMDAEGVISCACELGYEGARCDLCASGYAHGEFDDCLQQVLQDGVLVTIPASCGAESCHRHGQCRNMDPQLECDCYSGYSGARCDGCASGYHRPADIDRCIPSTTCDAPECGGCTAFDGARDIPPDPDTCSSSRDYRTDQLTIRSIGGEGTLWLCAPSQRYNLTTEHIGLEAGAVAGAEIRFDKPVVKLSFDYIPWEELSLQLLADGGASRELTGKRYQKQTVRLDFASPIRVVTFLSTTQDVQSFAIDDLRFESDPSTCP